MATPPDAPLPDRILALDMAMTLLSDLPAGVVATAGLSQLTADLLARVQPDHIMLPLWSRDHDATTAIERLQAIGFAGRITVLSRPLPDAPMVQAELRALGPGARLTLLVLQAG